MMEKDNDVKIDVKDETSQSCFSHEILNPDSGSLSKFCVGGRN